MHFKDVEDIRELVRTFETCELNPAEFRHYQHLAVALWYVKHFGYDVATEKMREGINRLAAAYGKMGYHETITLFWLELVRSFVAQTNGKEGMVDLANSLALNYGNNKALISNYYSEELLKSDRAKNGWVQPDLQALVFAAKSSSSEGGNKQRR